MFKLGKLVLVVDSVEKAIKFYTEKLLFSISGLECDDEGGVHISKAEVRKGKFSIIFRLPSIDELAEFSMIRRCSSRSIAILALAKKGISKYHAACKRKGLETSVEDGKQGPIRSFSIKDPFGLKLVFTEVDEISASSKIFNKKEFCGLDLKGETVNIKKDSDVPEHMVKWLKGFGISRRVAKKYIKMWSENV